MPQHSYGFYNDDRIAEKLIVNPIRNNGDCYTTHDAYELSYVPRPLPDGSVAICQEHVTDSLQALMKADYMLALNSGHNIRRCIICGRYFLLKSGVHALYCEGACPHAPGYTCRQFGTVELQKELAKDIPEGQSQGDRLCPHHEAICSGVRFHRRTQEKPRTMCGICSMMPCATRISPWRLWSSVFPLSAFTSTAGSPERPIRGAVRRRKKAGEQA